MYPPCPDAQAPPFCQSASERGVYEGPSHWSATGSGAALAVVFALVVITGNLRHGGKHGIGEVPNASDLSCQRGPSLLPNYWLNRKNCCVPGMGLVEVYWPLTMTGAGRFVVQTCEARLVVDCKANPV